MDQSRTGNRARWPVVVESVSLAVTYAAGTALAWLVWAPLALAYVIVVLASNLLFMVLICPYCLHCEARRYHVNDLG